MFRRLFATALGLASLTACHVHHVSMDQCPCVDIPDEYVHYSEGVDYECPWWENFDDEELNYWVEQALAGNFDLAQAWESLVQARADVCIDSSTLWPQLNINPSIEQIETPHNVGGATSSVRGYILQPKLTYEVDLWKRIDAKSKSAKLEACATYEDYLATQLVLSGTVTDLWFIIREQGALEALLEEQIAINRTLLELVELRFSVGESSALDVYQQRQQLASTRANVPPVVSRLKQSLHSMFVLSGEPPHDYCYDMTYTTLPKLPPFPNIGSPACLLWRRPDLRAEYLRLLEADYDLAQAVADLFPTLNLEIDYKFTATEAHRFFEKAVLTMAAKMVAPIFDGCRRRCQVQKSRSELYEQLQSFSQAFLDALLEVENIVVAEHYQVELLERLGEQMVLAQANLDEARWHYLHGLNDYLSVIAALQSLQNVQRRIIVERRVLLTQRSALYRALGG